MSSGIAVFALWTPAPAWACSFDTCSFTYAAPSFDVPSNAPALVFAAPPDSENTPEKNLLLTTLDGVPVPFTSERDPFTPLHSDFLTPLHFLVKPATPLVEGATYRLISVGKCIMNATDRGPAFGFDVTFTVGPPSELPSTLGSVTIHPEDSVNWPVPGGSSCVDNRLVSAAFLEVSTPELIAYYAVTRRTLQVDGQVWIEESYGKSMPGELLDATFPYSICEPGGWGLQAGRHHGELSMHVAGASTDPPPVSFDFDLNCAGVNAGPTGGCALSSSPERAGNPLAIGWALVAFAARRRRRRRGGSSSMPHELSASVGSRIQP
jgi:MYXO-CTERM domain-containing protein